MPLSELARRHTLHPVPRPRSDDRTDVATFIAELKVILECETTRDLSRKLGWAETDKERKLYRWARGEWAPRFSDTLMLLRAAGLLRETPVLTPKTLSSARPRSAEAMLAKILDLNVENFEKLNEAVGALVERVERLETRLPEPVAPARRRGRSSSTGS